MFHRHFGDHRINPTLLSRFYHMHKIKKKTVKFVKHIDPEKAQEYEQWRLDLKQKIVELKSQHYRIIWLDETIFTSKSIRIIEYTKNR